MTNDYKLAYGKYIELGIQYDYITWDDFVKKQFLQKMKAIDINFVKLAYRRMDEDEIDDIRDSWRDEALYLVWVLETFVIPAEEYELAQLLNDYIEYIKQIPGDKV